MKATASIDRDNWLNIVVEPETLQEQTQLTQLALARDSKADKVATFTLSDTGAMRTLISLRPAIIPFSRGGWKKPYVIEKQK